MCEIECLYVGLRTAAVRIPHVFLKSLIRVKTMNNDATHTRAMLQETLFAPYEPYLGVGTLPSCFAWQSDIRRCAWQKNRGATIGESQQLLNNDSVFSHE